MCLVLCIVYRPVCAGGHRCPRNTPRPPNADANARRPRRRTRCTPTATTVRDRNVIRRAARGTGARTRPLSTPRRPRPPKSRRPLYASRPPVDRPPMPLTRRLRRTAAPTHVVATARVARDRTARASTPSDGRAAVRTARAPTGDEHGATREGDRHEVCMHSVHRHCTQKLSESHFVAWRRSHRATPKVLRCPAAK